MIDHVLAAMASSYRARPVRFERLRCSRCGDLLFDSERVRGTCAFCATKLPASRPADAATPSAVTGAEAAERAALGGRER